MKYIRTKDGVYELKVNEELKAQKTSNYFYIHHKGYGCNLLYDKQDLKKFKQADSIEELCDAYVYYDFYTEQHEYLIKLVKENGCLYYQFLTGENKTLFTFQPDREKIYGAIWTDKGLIYVAKMNDKGELELL